MTTQPTIDTAAAHRAVAELHHRYLTSLFLLLVSRKGDKTAGEAAFRLFRRQHHEKFLPGLSKLGISHLPPAQMCAAYHYLSNGVGGVKVQYFPESEKKAWVRFVPPRWIYEGTAVSGIPTSVSRGILEGWYAQNGRTLNNPRLGFICVSQTMDGGIANPGLVGYFLEHEHELKDEERLQFRPEEEAEMPAFDPGLAPKLSDVDWPEARRAKAARNYAVEYIRNLLPVLASILGQHETASLGNLAARLTGMSYHDIFCDLAGLGRGGDSVSGPKGCAEVLMAFFQGCDDLATVSEEKGEVFVTVKTWRMVRGQGLVASCVFDAWFGLLEGLMSIHDRFVKVDCVKRMDEGEGEFVYRLRRVLPRPKF